MVGIRCPHGDGGERERAVFEGKVTHEANGAVDVMSKMRSQISWRAASSGNGSEAVALLEAMDMSGSHDSSSASMRSPMSVAMAN